MAARVGCRGRRWHGGGTNRKRCVPVVLRAFPRQDRSDLGVRVALGAHVIACASPSKLDIARTMGGADFVVDYTQDGWQNQVLKISGGARG
jgi:hypothetical protein